MSIQTYSNLGLRRGTVVLVENNPFWSGLYRLEAQKLRMLFGDDAYFVEHVGSTAIPGIVAKPIIDICISVPSLSAAEEYVAELAEIGYRRKINDENLNRLFFTKGTDDLRTHYLHVGAEGSGYVEDMLIFRDYLRVHREEALMYSMLKEHLQKSSESEQGAYSMEKQRFVSAILKLARSETGMLTNEKPRAMQNALEA